MLDACHPFDGRVRVRILKLSILLFSLFFYLYGVQFEFLPTYTSRFVLFAAWTYLALIFFTKRHIQLPFEFFIIAVVYSTTIAWVILISALYNFSDISVLFSIALLFFSAFLGGLFFALILKKMEFKFYQVIQVVQLVIVFQAFFIVLYFISWDFREFTFAYIPETGRIDHRENLFRSRGLTGGASATLSLKQSLGLLFTIYLISGVRWRSKQFVYLLLSFGLIFWSVILTGRTGLLMIPIVFLYVLVLLLLRQKLSKNLIFFVLGLPVISFLSFAFLRLGYEYILGGFTTPWSEDGFDLLIRWVSSEFINSEGLIRSRTAQALMSSHWFLPEDGLVLFFGDPTTWLVNRIPSDIGIVRLWHSVGLIGMLLIYCLFALVFLISILKARGIEARVFLFMLAFFLFATEMKEPFLTNVSVNSFFIMIFCYLVIYDRVDIKRINV